MQKIAIIGNVGGDPQHNEDVGVLNFSVACNAKVKGEEEVTWYRAAVWGKRAESLANVITKGTKVYIDGRLRVRTYQDQNGETRYSLDANVNELELLGGGSKGEKQQDEGGFPL